MNQVKVGEDERRGVGALEDYVRIPEFFDNRTWHDFLQPIAAHTASPTCSVVAGGPEGRRSAVTLPLCSTASMAASTAEASFFKPKLYSKRAPTEPMEPSGLALCWPAMSGAEPCTGSYRPTRSEEHTSELQSLRHL